MRRHNHKIVSMAILRSLNGLIVPIMLVRSRP